MVDETKEATSDASAAMKLASEQPTLGAVGIKLPPFWKSDPEVWFAQAEAQFATRNINQEASKHAHVIATLPPDVAVEVRDLLINPPSTNAYTHLKEQLIMSMTASEQRRVQMLLTEEELGDRKPSQLLRRMQRLLGEQKLEMGILKQLFLQRLPQSVRLILASTSDTMPLADLANLADRIIEAHVPSVNFVAPTNATVGATSAPASDMALQVAELTKLVKELSTTVVQLQRDRSRSRGRSRSRTDNKRGVAPNSTDTNDDGLCWYHSTYGDNARHCRIDCNRYSEQGN